MWFMLALFEHSKDFFLRFIKSLEHRNWITSLDFLSDLLLTGHLALTVHRVLWMPSSVARFSQYFLREVLFPEDSHKERKRKNFSAIGWTWQGCQLSPTECEIHQNGLDPPLLLFASCTCRELQNRDCSILSETFFLFPVNENTVLSRSVNYWLCTYSLPIWASTFLKELLILQLWQHFFVSDFICDTDIVWCLTGERKLCTRNVLFVYKYSHF